jgi:4-hydroxy-tetrahydrodipicolinate reductase
MRVALIGYGTMGKAIEKIAVERGHEIVLKLTEDNLHQKSDIKKADIAIEFTNPESAAANISMCFEENVPVVVGSTGWYQHFEEIKENCISKNQSLFYATNFSFGVNIFFELNKVLAKMMSKHTEYEASITEIHHIKKKDAPSGTAITLAEGLLEEHTGYHSFETNIPKHSAQVLPIKAIREADVPGTHSIQYSSAIDQITITHEAFSRKGFALGAVLAAEFLIGKKGVFTMKHLLNQTI